MVLVVILVGAATAIAIVFRSLDVILGLTGAIGGSVLVWILPGLFLLKMGEMGLPKEGLFRDEALLMSLVSPQSIPTVSPLPSLPSIPESTPTHLQSPFPSPSPPSSEDGTKLEIIPEDVPKPRFRKRGYALVIMGTILLCMGTAMTILQALN